MRQAPAATEVEKFVIGACLLEPEAMAMAAAALKDADFYLERHEVLWDALQTAYSQGNTLDALGLQTALLASKKYEKAGGDAYLKEIMADVVSVVNVDKHIAVLRDYGQRRRLIRSLGNSLEHAYDLAKPIQEVQSHAEAAVLDIGEAATQEKGLQHVSVHLKAAVQEFEDAARGKPQGLKTGLAEIDKVIRLRPSTTNVIAARPGMGKSALALQIALQCGEPVAMFTLEMLAIEQIERMVTMEDGRFDSYALRKPEVLKAYREAIEGIFKKIAGYPIFLNESSHLTPPQILQQCRRMKKKHGLGLVVVDFLQLVESGGKHESREREVNAVSKFMKRIANELMVPVIAVASLSRDCEKREDKRPLLSDLRESGQIESDAHTVLILYREEQYKATPENKGVVEVLIRKNKGGKTGKVFLTFMDNQTKFYDLPQDELQAKKKEQYTLSRKDYE